MKKISDAVGEIVDANPDLRSGLAQGLLNLSRVARHILPLVEARTSKSVQASAVAMALSRLRKRMKGEGPAPMGPLAHRVTVRRGLAVLTFANTPECLAGLPALQELVRRTDGFLTVTEGLREVTLIVEEHQVPTVPPTVGADPLRTAHGISGLSIGLTPEQLRTPGVLYRLLQPLALQGINVAELASTTREFHVYIRDRDVMLALDSLYAMYPRSPGGS